MQRDAARAGVARGYETLYEKPGFPIVSSIEKLLDARIGDMSGTSVRLALRPVDGSGKVELFERPADVFTSSARISYSDIDEIGEDDGDLLFCVDGKWLALRLAIPFDADWKDCSPINLSLWTVCEKGQMSWSVVERCDRLRLDRPADLPGCFAEATPLEDGTWRVDAYDNDLVHRLTLEAKSAKEAEVLACRAALRYGGQPPLRLGQDFSASASLLQAAKQSESLAELATFFSGPSDDLLADWAILSSQKPAEEASVEQAIGLLGPLETYLQGTEPSRYSCRLTPAAMAAVAAARSMGMDIPDDIAILRAGSIEAAADNLCRFSNQGMLMYRDLAFARRGDGWLVQKMDSDGSFFALDKYWKAGLGSPLMDQTISDLQQMELVQGACACGRWNPARAWIDDQVNAALDQGEEHHAIVDGRAFDKAWRSYETERARKRASEAVVNGIYGVDGFSREKLLSAWLPVADRFCPFGIDKEEFAAACARRFGVYDYERANAQLCEFGIAPKLSALPPADGQTRRWAVRLHEDGAVCGELGADAAGEICWTPRGGEPCALGSAAEAAGKMLRLAAAEQRAKDVSDFAVFPASDPFRKLAQQQEAPHQGAHLATA